MGRNTGPQIVDLFAGPGGWDEGLRELGAATDVLGIEWDADACATAEAAGHRRLHADVTEVNPSDYAGIDGLIASPPCQDWSAAGRRSNGGTRDLVYEPMRWVKALHPRWVALEQVRDVLDIWGHQAMVLSGMGYSVAYGVVNAADYGLPQHRHRALLLAVRDGVAHLPQPTHGRQQSLFGHERWRTMRDALGWDGYLDRRNIGAPIITTDRPAPTVTGVGVGAGQWLYRDRASEKWRAVTIEEGAALQGFPEGYPFCGSTKKSRGQQVGNAVPPPLAAAVLRDLIKTT